MRHIGVISDTHGLLRPEAVAALKGSDLILHAGDVGDAGILERLKRLAPVHAVRGNTDRGELRARLPGSVVVDLGSDSGALDEDGARGPVAYMLHDPAELDLDPGAAGIRVVIAGHTHRPEVVERGGVMYVNPGSAGPRRSDLPVTVARVTVAGGEEGETGVHVELVELVE